MPGHPEPRRRGLVPRPGADPRLRAVHHPRHRRRDLDRRAALGGPRRPGRRDQRPRDLGGAVRPGRRPALPRAHRLRALLRRGRATRSTALYVWRGGLGVWGAIAMGALGVVDRRQAARASSCCRSSTRWRPGCWSPRRSAAGATGSTRSCSASRPTCRGRWRSTPPTGRRATTQYETFHPTFLYEFLWSLAAFALVVWADRRFRLGHGRVVALYVMAYTLGRGWIEMLRIDDVQLDDVLGLRLNVWTSIVLFVVAAAYFVVSARRDPAARSTSTSGTARRGAPDVTRATDTVPVVDTVDALRRGRAATCSPPLSQPRRGDRVVA